MNDLLSMSNIGMKLKEQLIEVGINTPSELKEVGSKEAWLKIKAMDSSACINRLYALEGAIQEIRWFNLSQEDKMSLKEFYIEQTQ